MLHAHNCLGEVAVVKGLSQVDGNGITLLRPVVTYLKPTDDQAGHDAEAADNFSQHSPGRKWYCAHMRILASVKHETSVDHWPYTLLYLRLAAL